MSSLWNRQQNYARDKGASEPPTAASSQGGSDKPPPPTAASQLPGVTLPKGGGALKGIGEKVSADAALGTCSVSVPLPYSTCRSGFSPQAALTYDSGAGNGPFGLGWQLTLPMITRKSDKGLPKYADNLESDVFLLSQSEDLVPVLSKSGARVSSTRSLFGVEYNVFAYGPRVESSFARIERWSAAHTTKIFWRTISAENVTSLYGYDPGSCIVDPQDPEHVYAWQICRSWDAHGNVIAFTYVAEDSAGIAATAHERNRTIAERASQIYLKSMLYGNTVPFWPDWTAAEEQPLRSDWMFQVVLDYGDHIANPPTPAGDAPWPVRPDPFSSYRSGFELRTYRRARRLLFFQNFPNEPTCGADRLVRCLQLTYGDDEAAHDPAQAVYSLLTSVVSASYGSTGAMRALPPLTLAYTRPAISAAVLTLDPESMRNLPEGIDGGSSRLVDLDGEGLPGILFREEEAWYYKRNWSANCLAQQADGSYAARARFGPREVLPTLPTAAANAQLMDLSGSGMLDLVEMDGSAPGFFKRTADNDWTPFQRFLTRAEVDYADPNLKFIDLTGDGLADLLLTEDGLFTFYPSLGEEGFDAPAIVPTPWDEEKGPKIVFADGTETIFVADMSGDGLNDIVRVRNGEVCYWPNIGYGRFGARVTMDLAPRYGCEDDFDPRRVRLADVDGTGTADLLYISASGVQLWFNQTGNAWSAVNRLPVFPTASDPEGVQVADLLGTGTACLMWSSSLPGEAPLPMRYVDLMSGRKPHLLSNAINNMGTETRITYAPSTQFYRADADAGNPWVTRLPFPVQVVERVETLDWIGRNRFVQRYAYHHGYFDGFEREFRGFARVEQWDTEEFRTDTNFPESDWLNWDAASWAPPVKTVRWFHTGVFQNAGAVSRQLATEYWSEPALKHAGTAGAMSLTDTVLPPNLNPWEMQEACRALKGRPLRVEVYEVASPSIPIPYTVTESNYTITCLQPQGPNLHATFRVDPRETLTFSYEQEAFDPRVAHDVTLDCNAYGQPLRQVSVAYGRRGGYAAPEPTLSTAVQTALAFDQARLHVRATCKVYAGPVDDASQPDAYRVPLPCEVDEAEWTGLAPKSNVPGITNLFGFGELDGIWQSVWSLDGTPYEQLSAPEIDGVEAGPATPSCRLLSRTQTLYRSEDLTGMLPLGQVGPKALPGRTYSSALTPGLIAQVYGESVTPAMLQDCGYVQRPDDTGWWLASSLVFYSPGDSDTPVQELTYAREHFFQPDRSVNPFGNVVRVSYDVYDLLPTSSTDPVGNTVSAVQDYRVLAPIMVTDANGNQTAVLWDALSQVTAIAVAGKPTDAVSDSLSGLAPDLSAEELAAQFADPLADPAGLIGNATMRYLYDVDAYLRTAGIATTLPVAAYTLTRETHVADLAPGQTTRYQYALSYSDGMGRVIQTKRLVDPGPLTVGAPVTSPRWISSGWTILNNKGQPVRIYEPFFTASLLFEFASAVGVSTVHFYDAPGREVGALRPDATWSKTVIENWRQETWDGNDTALLDPATDAVIGPCFVRLPEGSGWISWHDKRIGGAYGASSEAQAAEADAAKKTEAHANTPQVSHFDPLRRTCLAVIDNADELRYGARTAFDTQGKPLVLFDTLGRRTEQYCLPGVLPGSYTCGLDMAGRQLYSINADANARRNLPNVLGQIVWAWDAREHTFRSAYDAAQRRTQRYVSTGGATEVLLDLAIYGERMPEANLCGRVFRQYDGAGFIENTLYDFEGNLLTAGRQLAVNSQGPPDWTPLASLTTAAALDSSAASAGLVPVNDGGRDRFVTLATYDALKRPVQTVTPHNSTMQPDVLQQVYSQSGELQTQDLWLQQAVAPGGLLDPTTADRHVVTAIETNARGQRTSVALGNGTITVYAYDPQTFRMVSLTTTRPATFSAAQQTVQALLYFYDPSGNITRIRDDADTQNVIFFANQRVEPSNDYTYDPLYRLVVALGREHLGQTGAGLSSPQQVTNDDSFRMALPQPSDGTAMGTYTESYAYDSVGNIFSVTHSTASGSWLRLYQYAEPSWIAPGEWGNRLTATTLPGDAATGQYSARYTYDAHGNMTSMPSLPSLTWDQDDRLQSTARQVVQSGTAGTTFYAYSGQGQRVRKSSYKAAAMGVTPVQQNERIYLGGTVEVYRESASDGSISLARETLHVAAGAQTALRVETRTAGTDPAPQQQVRYQYSNQLGSAVLELDNDAAILSYEEYFPHGSTSYQAVASQTDLPRRFRYTGKERDTESDLYYHDARYYAPWLGRWISCDPAGLADGSNLYAYVQNQPTTHHDPSGTEKKKPPAAAVGSQFQYRNRTPAIRDKAGKVISEDEHGIPGAARRALTRNPATGQSDFTAKDYRNSLVTRQPKDVADQKTRGGPNSDNARSRRLSSGGSLNEEIPAAIDNWRAADPKGSVSDASKVHAVLDDAGGMFQVQHPLQSPNQANPKQVAYDFTKSTEPVGPPVNPATGEVMKLRVATEPGPRVSVSEPRIRVAEPESASSVGSLAEEVAATGGRALAGAAKVAQGGLRVASMAVTVMGAGAEAQRTYDKEIAMHRGELNANVAQLSTFLITAAAGVVDDAVGAAAFEMGANPIGDSYDSVGSGPVQHAVGDALRSFYQWGAKNGF